MLRILALLLLAVEGAQALNPVHDASVEFIPAFSEPGSRPSFLLGQSYSGASRQKLRLHGAYLHPVRPDIRLGFAMLTRWYEEPNNVRHFVFGGAYRPGPPWTLQADVLWGVANYAGDGFTLTCRYLGEPFAALHLLGMGRVGFFDALVWHPDKAVVSASITPRLLLSQKVHLDLEILSAAQLPGAADFYSLDLGPALVYRVSRDLALRAGAHVGLGGPEKTSPRFELAQEIAL